MLLGNDRREMYTDYRTNLDTCHLLTPLSTPSTSTRTPVTPQKTMMNYARTPYCYTTATLLSLRPPLEVKIFPDHLLDSRFLDEENYIDLDRMLTEHGGQFELESFDMHNRPIMPRRIHKYDFSDPVVIEKVKNRRPKDPLTPQQVAALTSVATRHQSSTSLFPHQVQSPHVWVDDYSHQQTRANSSRHHLPPQPSMPYQRQNPNQCEIYTNQIKSLLPTFQTDANPILQRLFEAQRAQQNEQSKSDRFAEPSALCTPSTPKTLDWLFSSNPKDTFSQLLNEHLKGSTVMETPVTPAKVHRASIDDDDEQNFYSAPPSPTKQDDPLSFFSSNRISLENWFGNSIHKTTYPRMPSDRVLSACDLEQ